MILRQMLWFHRKMRPSSSMVLDISPKPTPLYALSCPPSSERKSISIAAMLELISFLAMSFILQLANPIRFHPMPTVSSFSAGCVQSNNLLNERGSSGSGWNEGLEQLHNEYTKKVALSIFLIKLVIS